MSEFPPNGEAPAPQEPAPPQGHPVIAWSVILLIAVVTILLQRWAASQTAKKQGEGLRQTLVEVQGRYCVGVSELVPSFRGEMYAAAKGLKEGPYRQRLAFVTLAGEFEGPEEAVRQLRDLGRQGEDEAGEELSDTERELRALLSRLYSSYEEGRYGPDVLSGEEKELLRRELGWYGRLALHPPETPEKEARAEVLASAKRAVLGALGLLAGLLLCVIGFVVLIFFLILAANGRLTPGFETGSPFGTLYAETFAVWLVLFLGLHSAGEFLPTRDGGARTLTGALLSLCSLLALAWPVWRGVPWRQVRRDIGWTYGRSPAEPLYGVPVYLLCLPLLAAGAVLVQLLMRLDRAAGGEGGEDVPTHPIFFEVPQADWLGLLQLLFLAAVVAPVFEETMFRGVLYRHLREATSRWSRVGSMLLSALVNAIIFAVIHPQGLLATPALAALAIGFSLGREWRGSVVPAMVAHGIHNGALLMLVWLVFSP